MNYAARHLTKTWLANAAYYGGPLSALVHIRRFARGPAVHLFGFHRIVDQPQQMRHAIPALFISTAHFTRLMELLAQHFVVLPLEQVAVALSGAVPLERDGAVITFDDGYRDVYLRALPVLRRLNLPATIFVPTGFIGSNERLLHDRFYSLLERAVDRRQSLLEVRLPRLLRPALQATERLLYRHPPSVALDRLIATLPHAALERCASELERLLGTSRAPKEDEGGLVMSESELRACAEQGMSLGAHTRDHVVLTHERPARIWRELHPPRRELEAISGRACTSFAYCNGHLSDDLVAAVRRAGYTLAVTTHDAPNLPGQDLFRLRRKVLWDNHVRTLEGRFSPALAAAHLHGLFQRTA